MAGRSVLYLILSVFAFVWVYPFIWMITASFKTQDEFWGSGLNIFPQNPTLDNFIRSWNNANFSQYFSNTIIVTISSVIIVLLCTSAAGYALGRYMFPGKKVVLGIFMASITIPLTFTIIPIYELLNGLHMTNSLLGLIIAECGGSHILFLMLFSSFYTSIPNEMEEAAIVDGCGFLQTYFKIMFPLGKPVIVTVVIMQFIWTWNSFLLPLVLTLSKPELRTLAVGLYALKGEHVVDWTGIAAGASIAVVPVIVLFICLQKYFVDGIAGAVKS
nr:carbohydrate ABC transporter permease [Hungatella sp.]